MKKVYYLVGVILLFVNSYSCQKVGETDENKFEEKTITLKFELENKEIKEVMTQIEYIGKNPKLISNELEEFIIKDKETNKKISVFTLKDNDVKVKQPVLSTRVAEVSEGECRIEFKRGYGFDGRCFSYGTIITGSDCEQYFIPARVTEYVGFDRICPDRGEAFATDNKKIVQ